MTNITIHRCPHDQKNPYVMINNNLIRDKTISPECRWLLIYLLSNEEGWKISVNQLRGHLKEFAGRDKIYDMLKEAVTAGYMELQEFLDKGLKRCRYVISETPKFKKCLPRPELPDTAQQEADSLYSKKDHKKEKEERERVKPAPRAPSSKKIQRTQDVFTTEEEHADLIKSYGAEQIPVLYQILQDWKEDTPKSKWKRNDYKAILRWVVQAYNERKGHSKSSGEGDRKLAEKIWNKWKGRNDIHLGPDYLEFVQGVNSPTIFLKFGTKGFREECLNQLRKRKLKTEDL